MQVVVGIDLGFGADNQLREVVWNILVSRIKWLQMKKSLVIAMHSVSCTFSFEEAGPSVEITFLML